MKERKVILGSNLITYILFILYINTRNIIDNTSYLWFQSCFILSTITIIIVLILEIVEVKELILKKKIRNLCLIEISAYLSTFFIFHIVNNPLIFSIVMVVCWLISNKLIIEIYKLSNNENMVYNFTLNYNSSNEEELKIEVNKLRKIRNILFLIQFINIALKDISNIKIIIFIIEYLIIAILAVNYLIEIKVLRDNKEMYRRGVISLILYFLIHSIFVTMLIIDFGGILIYCTFSMAVIPMSNFIRDNCTKYI